MATQQRIGKTATSTKRDASGTLRVTYHSTVVVQVEAVGDNACGRITLNHGGWLTATTKSRMNQASNQFGLGFSVWQKAGEWFVTFKGRVIPFGRGPLVLE